MWYSLESDSQLKSLVEKSDSTPFILFKHSTRCPLSGMVRRRFESEWPKDSLPVYELDLLSYRSLSNFIANHFGVDHQSPQVLLIKDGIAIWNGSHHEIDAETIFKKLS